jgi:hypothetical protein
MAAAHKIMNEYSFIYQGRFTVSSENPPALSSWADSILIILFYTKGIAQEVQPQPSKTVGMRTYIQHEQPFTNPDFDFDLDLDKTIYMGSPWAGKAGPRQS